MICELTTLSTSDQRLAEPCLRYLISSGQLSLIPNILLLTNQQAFSHLDTGISQFIRRFMDIHQESTIGHQGISREQLPCHQHWRDEDQLQCRILLCLIG
jgi:hypothetical protein